MNETTRADLVLLIGAPDQTHGGEQYFIYVWEATDGIIVAPYAAADVEKNHYFCVEFDEYNRIKRFKHIYPGLIDSLYKGGSDAYVDFYDWINNEK